MFWIYIAYAEYCSLNTHVATLVLVRRVSDKIPLGSFTRTNYLLVLKLVKRYGLVSLNYTGPKELVEVNYEVVGGEI